MTSGTTDQIIRATGRALREYGYAELTMQRIAEESSISTAAIHYHFDTKEELLNGFLDTLTEQFKQQLDCGASDPRERLLAVLDAVFAPVEPGADDFPIALMELKSQAPYHQTYRERFVELDEAIRTVVATAVREGIDAGYFDESDPEEVARFVSTAINGGHARKIALGEDPDETRRMIEEYLALQLGWQPEVIA